MAAARYAAKLEASRLARVRDIMPGKLPVRATQVYPPEAYEMEDDIKPVADRTFYKILKRWGVCWSLNAKPYVCPICLHGPSDAALLKDVLHKIASIKVEQKQGKSSDNDEAAKLHTEQLRLNLANLSSTQQQVSAKQDENKAHLRQYTV